LNRSARNMAGWVSARRREYILSVDRDRTRRHPDGRGMRGRTALRPSEASNRLPRRSIVIGNRGYPGRRTENPYMRGARAETHVPTATSGRENSCGAMIHPFGPWLRCPLHSRASAYRGIAAETTASSQGSRGGPQGAHLAGYARVFHRFSRSARPWSDQVATNCPSRSRRRPRRAGLRRPTARLFALRC
jgi:hypothetical protein